MLADLKIVFWKEIKEILWLYKSARVNIIAVIIAFVFIGIIMPYKIGPAFVTSPVTPPIFCFLPLMLVLMAAAESFAGERERKTLETLLASRLPDRAILGGKISALVGFAWSVTMAFTLICLIAVNIFHAADAGLLFFSPAYCIDIIFLPTLSSLLGASLGVLISLRCATVRQAQQTLSLIIIPLIFLPSFLIPALPGELRKSLFKFLESSSYNEIMLTLAAVLISIDVCLILAAMARFKRSKLILD